jgi:hypothetical protein
MSVAHGERYKIVKDAESFAECGTERLDKVCDGLLSVMMFILAKDCQVLYML